VISICDGLIDNLQPAAAASVIPNIRQQQLPNPGSAYDPPKATGRHQVDFFRPYGLHEMRTFSIDDPGVSLFFMRFHACSLCKQG